MVRQRQGQPGEGRASRELCTFYTFVLCTALLILHPIMLLLEPICKKLLQKFICVYVNNSTQKQERKNSVLIYGFFSFLFFFFLVSLCFRPFFLFLIIFSFPVLGFSFLWVYGCPDTPAEIRRLQIHPIHLLCGFAIQAWSVFTKIITVVFFALVLDAQTEKLKKITCKMAC